MTKPTRPNTRALKALDAMWDDANLLARWHMLRLTLPPQSAMYRRALAESGKVRSRLIRNYGVVALALGRDPDDDEPSPRRHWDAGA